MSVAPKWSSLTVSLLLSKVFEMERHRVDSRFIHSDVKLQWFNHSTRPMIVLHGIVECDEKVRGYMSWFAWVIDCDMSTDESVIMAYMRDKVCHAIRHLNSFLDPRWPAGPERRNWR